MGLVFHVLAGAGTLAEHVRELTGKRITDGALSQRRTALPWMIFEMILDTASGRKTKSEQHGIGEEEFAPWSIGPTL